MKSIALGSVLALSIAWLAGGCGDVRSRGTGGDGADDGDDGGTLSGFTVATAVERLFLRQGESAPLEVSVQREADFDDPITVELAGLPSGVTAEPLALDGDASSGTMTVSAADDSAQGAVDIDVTGRAGDATGDTGLHLVVAGPPGTVDRSFADDGVFIYSFQGTASSGEGIAVQPDGKLVVTGASGGNVLTLRLAPDGSLDDTFGDQGAALHGAGSSGGRVVATAGADRILVGGVAQPAAVSDMALFAYTAAGDRDATFGVDGVAFADTAASAGTMGQIVVEPDGDILAIGTGVSDVFADQDALHVFRYSPTGAQDPAFHITRVGLSPTSAIVDRSGRLVIAGTTFVADEFDFFLARYLPDGAPDPTFGDGGAALLNFAADGIVSADAALAILEETDGKLLVTGSVLSGGFELAGLARYNPDGTLDPTFGQGGIATPPVAIHAAGATFDSAGRPLVLGFAPSQPPRPALVRFLPDSTPDSTFGAEAIAVITFPPDTLGPSASVRAAAFDSDDRIVTVGSIGTAGQPFLIVARLWP
jgi:uncharacterized delta-60 repeat protein